MQPARADCGGSQQRQRQMLWRHMYARRLGKTPGSDRQRVLQAKLYRFLDDKRSAAAPKIVDSSRYESDKHKTAPSVELQRRGLLLDAIASLDQMSGFKAPIALKFASNTNAGTETPEAQPCNIAPEHHHLVQHSQKLTQQLQNIALACNPTVKARGGVKFNCAETQLAQRADALRRLIDRMQQTHARLKCVDSVNGDYSCESERLFLRLPNNKSDFNVCDFCQKQQQQQTLQAGQQRKRDPVVQQVKHSRAALIGDSIFNVSCTGKKHSYGRMILPTDGDGPNVANQLRRRHRVTACREAMRADTLEFANELEEMWETIEKARMNRDIDVARKRLTRVLRQRY